MKFVQVYEGVGDWLLCEVGFVYGMNCASDTEEGVSVFRCKVCFRSEDFLKFDGKENGNQNK